MHRYEGLDALRGVAAAAIVVVHGDFIRGVPSFSGGVLAVDIFFALSGFVIADAYEKKLRDGMSPVQFVGLRFLRFYPVYLVGFLISLAAMILRDAVGKGSPESFDTITAVLGLFMIPSVHLIGVPAAQLFPMNIVVWSLFFELIVNGLFGLFLYRMASKALLVFSGFLLIVVTAYSVAFNGIDAGFDWGTFAFGFVRALFSFVVGMTVFRLRHVFPAIPVAMALSPALLVAALVARSYLEDVSLFDAFYVAVFVPILVMINSNKVTFPIFGSVFQFFAYISYALYIVHVPLSFFFGGIYSRLMPPSVILSLGVGFGFFLLAVGFSYLVTRCVDDPARAWLKGRSRPKLMRPGSAEAG